MDAGWLSPGFGNSGQTGRRVSETASVPWSLHRDGRDAPLSPQARALLRFWGAEQQAAYHRGSALGVGTVRLVVGRWPVHETV